MVLHPSDWRKMQVIKENSLGANTGNYILGGPAASPRKQLWDLPIVTTPAMLAGKFLVGAFQGNVQGFDRMRATVDVSTEHEDYFTRNMIAIRCEERVGLAIMSAAAFNYGSFA